MEVRITDKGAGMDGWYEYQWRGKGDGGALGRVVPFDPLVQEYAIPPLGAGRPRDAIRCKGPHS